VAAGGTPHFPPLLAYGDRIHVPCDGTLTSHFLPSRVSPIDGTPRPHPAIDIGKSGHPVGIYAVAAGTIKSISFDAGGWGIYVIIEHNLTPAQGSPAALGESLYAHLHKFRPDLSVGTVVGAGENIGIMGTTGGSTGQHLHLEIKNSHGVKVDPIQSFGWQSMGTGYSRYYVFEQTGASAPAWGSNIVQRSVSSSDATTRQPTGWAPVYWRLLKNPPGHPTYLDP